MSNQDLGRILLGWTIAMSAWAFVLFAFDKWRAGRGGRRVSEATLAWVCALGGWPGGLLAMILFRHKSAKGSFQLKFVAAVFGWAALLGGAWLLVGIGGG
jgi:uncharacterized membrane protein YsdA (DUF1294 family)